MQITKLSSHIGAEVTDVDLSSPLDPETRDTLYGALVDNIVIVIRDQQLTVDSFLEAAEVFGDVFTELNNDLEPADGHPVVRRISNQDVGMKENKLRVSQEHQYALWPLTGPPSWHSDHTNLERPPKFTILYAIELPDHGGATSFASTRAVYDTLSSEKKAEIADLQTLNAFQYGAPTVHPLVRTNPDNDTKAIYLHPKKLQGIVDMDDDDARSLTTELMEVVDEHEDFTYTHDWKPGDMVIWDNRSSWHKAPADVPSDQSRLLYRLMIQGERPH